jgi:hypothetical protein
VTAIWLKRWSWGGEVILGVVKLVGKNSGWGKGYANEWKLLFV